MRKGVVEKLRREETGEMRWRRVERKRWSVREDIVAFVVVGLVVWTKR